MIGTKGSLQWNLSDGATRIFRAERSRSDNGGAVEAGEKAWGVYQTAPEFERNVLFMDEMKHFIAVARGEVESSCPLEDGIKVQRLISAVQASSTSGARIKLSNQ